MNPLLFPPALIKRAYEDLGRLASRLEDLPAEVTGRLDELIGLLQALRADTRSLATVPAKLDALHDEVRPIQEIEAVSAKLDQLRDDVRPIQEIEAVSAKLDQLRDDVRPIQEIEAVSAKLDALRAAIEPLGGKLDDLRDEMQPIKHLSHVRAGIEPLDEDLHEVRTSIERIEPLAERIGALVADIDQRLDGMGTDLAPVGELAEKMPGVGRR